MKRLLTASVFTVLFASAAIAGGPPWAGGGSSGDGSAFSQSGSGEGFGAVGSFSTSAGGSVTGVFGNGSAEQQSFSGATQSDLASFGTSWEDGTIQIQTNTLSQGETFSSSEGWTTGNALGMTGALSGRAGFAGAEGGFATEFEFGEGSGGANWTPPGWNNVDWNQ